MIVNQITIHYTLRRARTTCSASKCTSSAQPGSNRAAGASLPFAFDRVGYRGLRPGALPRQRTYGLARADGSYASANDPRVLVGLGDSTDVTAVRAYWPNGRVEEWTNVSFDRYTTLREGSGKPVR